MGATTLLTMSVILLMISDLMPKSAAHFPVLGQPLPMHSTPASVSLLG